MKTKIILVILSLNLMHISTQGPYAAAEKYCNEQGGNFSINEDSSQPERCSIGGRNGKTYVMRDKGEWGSNDWYIAECLWGC